MQGIAVAVLCYAMLCEAAARGAAVGTPQEAERWLREQFVGGVQRRIHMRPFAPYNPAAGVQVGAAQHRVAHSLA